MTWRGDDDDREQVRLLYRALRDVQHKHDEADLVSVRRCPDGVVIVGSAEAIADLAAALLEAAPRLLPDRPERCGQLGAVGAALYVALGRPDVGSGTAVLREK